MDATPTEHELDKSYHRKMKIRLGVFLVIALLIGAGSIGAIQILQKNTTYIESEAGITNPEYLKADQLVLRVSKLIDLPKDEAPTVATVSDTTKLGNHDFFKHARQGDNVLIYSKHKKVILYRSSENRIVDVGSAENK